MLLKDKKELKCAKTTVNQTKMLLKDNYNILEYSPFLTGTAFARSPCLGQQTNSTPEKTSIPQGKSMAKLFTFIPRSWHALAAVWFHLSKSQHRVWLWIWSKRQCSGTKRASLWKAPAVGVVILEKRYREDPDGEASVLRRKSKEISSLDGRRRPNTGITNCAKRLSDFSSSRNRKANLIGFGAQVHLAFVSRQFVESTMFQNCFGMKQHQVPISFLELLLERGTTFSKG